MAADEKWYFTKEQLMCAPSRKYGYDADKELSCRQQAANFIQDMGQRLQVTQLCINTAIVYMHRFYMFHSFTQFHRNHMASAALFLAAKVEEQPRKLEHVIKVSQICLHRDMAPPDVKSQAYNEQAQELVVNENILLQTLGFDVAIDHPHTHVVKCCHLVRASKDLAQTSYFMASNSLHLTTMCLQYKPTVVACFCIHLACKWSNWEFNKLQIPQSTEGKPWFWYIDKTVTQELLEQLTEEFLGIFDKCPSRLKKKIVSLSQSQNPTILSQFNDVRSSKDDKKRNGDGSLSDQSAAGVAWRLPLPPPQFGGNSARWPWHSPNSPKTSPDSHLPESSTCFLSPSWGSSVSWASAGNSHHHDHSRSLPTSPRSEPPTSPSPFSSNLDPYSPRDPPITYEDQPDSPPPESNISSPCSSPILLPEEPQLQPGIEPPNNSWLFLRAEHFPEEAQAYSPRDPPFPSSDLPMDWMEQPTCSSDSMDSHSSNCQLKRCRYTKRSTNE
uniref:Cyclin-T1 n=1 Tax=Lygus hesperus TaxID=30085 RepID=A0A0A9WEZ5_LYGHE